jgi:ABC-2 type transport system ATP-binding protein
MPADAVVRFEHARRSFGGVVAVDDLNLDVQSGAVTVLLGPNGAGKTTALRMVTGALLTEAGSIRVHGLDPDKDGEEVRRNIGVVSAKPALYDRLSGWDNLRYAAELWKLGPSAPIEEAAKRFGIGGALDVRVGGYSTGMKTRLALARAILHDPELLLLDEPTSGLDPESSQAVLQLIHELAAGGKAVIMCTHLLLEAEGLADHVVLLQDGRDVVSGPPRDLVKQYWPVPEVVLDADDRPALLRVLQGADGSPPTGIGSVVETARGGFTVQVDRIERTPDIVATLVAAGIRLTRVAPHDPSLEELYLAVRRSGGWAPAADLPEVRI